MDPIKSDELDDLFAELEVIELADVTEVTEGDSRCDGDCIDSDNIVWGNI